MSIYCQICNIEFQKLITSTHLKKHNLLTSEYVSKFGKESLSSPEYRKARSEKNKGVNNPNFGNKLSDENKQKISIANKGHIPWNLGKKVEDTTIYRDASHNREQKYKTGELVRSTTVMSMVTKEKISCGVKEYATFNHDELSSRAYKALSTKKELGYDLAFFKGKNHTEETKKKISIKSIKIAEKKQKESLDLMKSRLSQIGFTTIDEDIKWLTVSCNTCRNEITYTKQMFQPSKIKDTMCWICHPPLINKSKSELEIYEYIKSLKDDALSGYRFDGRREIDIFVPSNNIGFEYNGLYWHSENVLESNGYSKTKDYEKLKDVNDLGIRLIQIFEDEWMNKKDIVKNRISRILKINKSPTIYARKCLVKEIDSTEASLFCNTYHLQGTGRSNVRLGLYYNDILISVMTFSKNNLSRKVGKWELNRFCSADFNIPGAASKLFSKFISLYDPDEIVTYADRRWSDGNLYSVLGFNFDKYTVPGYWYLQDNLTKRIHRFSLRKTVHDSSDMSEREIRKAEGYKCIWDSGNSKWTWNK